MHPAAWRPLRPEDLDELVEVQEAGAVAGLDRVFDQQVYPFPRATVRDRWARELADPVFCCAVAEQGGSIVGFAAVRGDELLHFGTAVSTWGSGLASTLLDALVRDWLPHGPLRLWVFEDNVRARRFYSKHGWRATGSRTRSSFAPHPVLLEYMLDRS
jgi:GNAT superfamily N-acetyltransferase